MTQISQAPIDLRLDELRAGIIGRIVTAADPDYDALRTVMLGGIDARPGAIVRVANAADVAAAVRHAGAHDLEIAVRSGGHSGAGYSTVDRGLVVDLRELTSLDIDAAGRTAWAGAGLTAGAYTTAVGAQGLATGFGDTGSVGLGGITTGGGVGYLGRHHGLTIDNLVAAEIVTADGHVRVVDAEHEPDLFWAIRGGGGNFGIVTRFRYRLHEVPSVVGGILVLPATADVLAGFVAAADAAPDRLSTIANVMPCPPMPFVPAERHGELVTLAIVVFDGPDADGERAIAPFRALATPIADLVRSMPYPDIYPPDDADYHPTAVSLTLFMDRLGTDEATTIVEHLAASDASMRVAQVRVMGGAIARVRADATAYAHRDRKIMVNVAAFYEGEADRPGRQAWVEGFAAALRQGPPAAYVNFLGDEGAARVHEAYPGATWDRLVAIKARYDPSNLFRRNQNIPPAG